MNNFDIRCINQSYVEPFTVDKIYEVRNGKMFDDEGNIWRGYTSIDEINEDFVNDDVDFEFVKEVIILKELLKPCMVVELRSGNLCVVAQVDKGIVLLTELDTFLDLSDYDDRLKCKDTDFSELDINKIYGFSTTCIDANRFKISNRPLIWIRKEKPKVTKITIEEIKQLLNIDGELEIVKEQESSRIVVRCVSSEDWFFKEGNTYEINDGILTDECGGSWIIDTILECLHKKFNARFEIVN